MQKIFAIFQEPGDPYSQVLHGVFHHNGVLRPAQYAASKTAFVYQRVFLLSSDGERLRVVVDLKDLHNHNCVQILFPSFEDPDAECTHFDAKRITSREFAIYYTLPTKGPQNKPVLAMNPLSTFANQLIHHAITFAEQTSLQ